MVYDEQTNLLLDEKNNISVVQISFMYHFESNLPYQTFCFDIVSNYNALQIYTEKRCSVSFFTCSKFKFELNPSSILKTF